jgi:hypothetical protein
MITEAQGTIMAKTGRKRKSGKRYSSGDLIRAGLEDRRGPMLLKRIFDNMLKDARDPALGTPIGRMLREGFISFAEYNAGVKFAFLRARADRAMGVPARNPKALKYEHGIGGRDLTLDDPEAERAIVDALEALESAIGPHSMALIAMYQVVIEEQEPCGYLEKIAVRAGLNVAAGHWGLLTNQKKNGSRVGK